jgi:hypothetical protein
VDAQRRPVSNAFVVVEEGTAPTPEIGIVTGEEGQFWLALPEGRFRVAARTEDGEFGWCELDTSDEITEIVIQVAEQR